MYPIVFITYYYDCGEKSLSGYRREIEERMGAGRYSYEQRARVLKCFL